MLKIDRSNFLFSGNDIRKNHQKNASLWAFACSKDTSQPARLLRNRGGPQEMQTSAGTCRERCPIPHSQAFGTFHQVPHVLLYHSVIFRSQPKVGGQAGPCAKEQSESKRTCFHCLLYKKNYVPGKLLSLQCNFHL